MVSLLWDAGLIVAAIEVEAMWNELGASIRSPCSAPTRRSRRRWRLPPDKPAAEESDVLPTG
jgi:hypothetical protein